MGDQSSDPPSPGPRASMDVSAATMTPAAADGGGERAPEGPGAPTGQAASFDPRTWVPEPAVRLAPARPTPSRRPVWIGALIIVGLAGLLATGGGLILARRPEAAAPPPGGLERRALVVASPGDVGPALLSAGVAADDARSAAALAGARLAPDGGDLTLVLRVVPRAGGDRLAGLEARRESGAGVIVERAASGAFVAHPTAADLKTVVRVVRGEMNADSFQASALAQHLTDTLISPFAQALAFDFDFQRDVHAGDIFEAAFEDRVNARGESVGAGRLLYVSLETRAKSVALYWFQDPSGKAGWFDGDGRSTVRALMRTPVDGARISSAFGMREHPILGFTKMHNGIDFAAPVGTPIYAAGDGVVLHAESKALDGNYVEIAHDNGWHTLYLHLDSFAAGTVAGARVRQGQRIGAVGVTGRSTGPHLHYEVHVGGAPVDPMTLKMDAAPVLTGAALKAYFTERDRIDALRAAQTG